VITTINKIQQQKVIASSLILLGLVGLLLSLLGEMTSLGDYKSFAPREWEEFNPELVVETPDLVSLQQKAHFLVNQSQSRKQC